MVRIVFHSDHKNFEYERFSRSVGHKAKDVRISNQPVVTDICDSKYNSSTTPSKIKTLLRTKKGAKLAGFN